jgi:hypothetical protein
MMVPSIGVSPCSCQGAMRCFWLGDWGLGDEVGLVVGEYGIAAAADEADDCGIVFPPLGSFAVAELFWVAWSR